MRSPAGCLRTTDETAEGLEVAVGVGLPNIELELGDAAGVGGVPHEGFGTHCPR